MYHLVYLRRNANESQAMMELRIESLCDTFAKDGATIVNVSLMSEAVEAWIVLRYPTPAEKDESLCNLRHLTR